MSKIPSLSYQETEASWHTTEKSDELERDPEVKQNELHGWQRKRLIISRKDVHVDIDDVVDKGYIYKEKAAGTEVKELSRFIEELDVKSDQGIKSNRPKPG